MHERVVIRPRSLRELGAVVIEKLAGEKHELRSVWKSDWDKIQSLLAAINSIDRASDPGQTENNFLRGQILSILRREGLADIFALPQRFDPQTRELGEVTVAPFNNALHIEGWIVPDLRYSELDRVVFDIQTYSHEGQIINRRLGASSSPVRVVPIPSSL